MNAPKPPTKILSLALSKLDIDKLRDDIAVKAMLMALKSTINNPCCEVVTNKEIADRAYGLADAMIQAREGKP